MCPSNRELAVVVLSRGNSKGLLSAVCSLLKQNEPAEIMVVNSGGGDPESTLREAGLDINVVTRADRVYPGAARNLGIQKTVAPWVAFLAADCVAEPGWVAGRIREHRAGADVVSSAVTNANPCNPFAIASHVLTFSSRMPNLLDRHWSHYGGSYRRDLFAQFGPFREDLRTGEDTEFHDRIAGQVRFSAARDVRSRHQHPTTLTGMCRDQFARGQLFARTLSKLSARDITAKPISQWSISKLRRKVSNCWLAVRAWERLALCLSLPCVFLGWTFYCCGAQLAYRDPYAMDQATARKIYALLAFHNEIESLPGYFENVSQHVDGIIALDDGSDDGSAEFVSRQDNVLQLLRKEPRHEHEWDETDNQRRLIEAAGNFEPDWLLAVDADERLERHFRVRALGELGRAMREGIDAFTVILRELWDEPDFYRVDGVWGEKRRARLFRWRPDHQFESRKFHGQWAPANSARRKQFPPADLIIYHLSMIDPVERWARREFYESVDADHQWQPQGYDYLTDESGKILESLPPGRDYYPLGR